MADGIGLYKSQDPKTKNAAPLSLVCQGYTVLQVKPSVQSRVCHCLYLQEHSTSAAKVEWPQGRTLLVHNVPPYCTEDNIRLLFQGCGDIVRIYLQPKPSSVPSRVSQPAQRSVQVAYVVFRKASGLKKACELSYDEVRLLSGKDVSIIAGLRAYVKEYENSIVDVAALEKNAEEFMAKYYKEKDEEEKREKDMEGVPDEGGFIKVTRHGKSKGSRRTEETERKGHEHIRSRKKKNELKDFYTFQFRETKRKYIADLQAKFEEDKKKVNEMKMARKFRPY